MVVCNNCAPGLTVESFLETLLEEVQHSSKRVDYRLEIECLWHWYTTTIEFELSNHGTLSHWHTTLPRLLLFLGKHLESKGYHLVSVPFSLFRELRSTGCFKVQVMHFQMEFFDLFDVPLNAVLDEFEKRNSRRNIPNFRMCRQYPWAALFRMCRQFSSECFHVAQL